MHSFCGKYILQRTLYSDNIWKVSIRTLVQPVSLYRRSISSSTNNENIVAETDEIYNLPSEILKSGQNVILVVQVHV